MTRDSGHIQESDAKYINKKRARKGDPPIEPLYTEADAAIAAKQLVAKELELPFEPVPGGIAKLREAGHILGSAGIDLTLEEGGRRIRLMFSGDIGRVDLPIIRDPVFPEDVDYLIMECTYGDSLHDPPDKAYEGLLKIVRKTVSRGGKIVIPAFAVGRTQTLVYLLHEMMDRNDIAPIKIFVDSPLAISVTEIFEKHPECFDEEARAFLEQDPHGSSLGFDRVSYTRTVAESKAINEFEGPAVIISASGMAEVGRILHHLKHNIGDRKNTILITSWMAPHTLGRRLVEGEKRIKIFGETYSVKANVESLNGLSAHGDQAFLLEYARAVQGRVKKIFLVHGEPKPASVLRERLEAEGFEVEYPEFGASFEL
jgi:metallo-beta-lactamase family protein